MTLLTRPQPVRRKAVWGPKATLAAFLIAVVGFSPRASAQSHAAQGPKAKPAAPSSRVRNYKADDEVTRRLNGNPSDKTSVIVTLQQGAQLPPQFRRYVISEHLSIINGIVLDLPNGILKQLVRMPEVFRVHFNRPTAGFNYRTSVTVGATTVRASMGYDGAGIGVAVIDSGIASWHDDLSGATNAVVHPYGNQRVRMFVDFVSGRALPYDDNGHGTHVSGIVAGNGYDSNGSKAGIAPGASIISLKVLNANGVGTIGSMISALNWIAANHKAHNIRVVNMSVGARITESYWTDPLTLATKALTDRGIVVVGAAGNFGKNAAGHLQYGGITAPANAPWVLTVGASSTNGSPTRNDDTVASFSSSGPTKIDFGAKPDLVAPGTATVSLSVPGSTFYATKSEFLVGGNSLGYRPYLALSGTSMAAPVVSGSVALMLQANPNLSPNLVKAILQYTSQRYPGYNALRQGAGFLNTLGAVRLAQFYASNKVGSRMPVQAAWSRQLIWGNHRISGGYINPKANAWSTSVIWGAAQSFDGDNIIWGTDCPGGACDNIIWGTNDADLDNIIWGTHFDADNIIWGTDFDNIIWGTQFDGDNIIWGTNDADNIIWGTAEQGASVVWLSSDLDNIIWGTSADSDESWGSSGEDEMLFPDTEPTDPLPSVLEEFGEAITSVGGVL